MRCSEQGWLHHTPWSTHGCRDRSGLPGGELPQGQPCPGPTGRRRDKDTRVTAVRPALLSPERATPVSSQYTYWSHSPSERQDSPGWGGLPIVFSSVSFALVSASLPSITKVTWDHHGRDGGYQHRGTPCVLEGIPMFCPPLPELPRGTSPLRLPGPRLEHPQPHSPKATKGGGPAKSQEFYCLNIQHQVLVNPWRELHSGTVGRMGPGGLGWDKSGSHSYGESCGGGGSHSPLPSWLPRVLPSVISRAISLWDKLLKPPPCAEHQLFPGLGWQQLSICPPLKNPLPITHCQFWPEPATSSPAPGDPR